MKLLNIGFGNMVNADRIIDASYGRRTQAVLIMDSDHVILSGIPLESITGRAAEESEEKRK